MPISSSLASAVIMRRLIFFICDSLFIMKYTSGNTSGSATTIDAMATST